MPATPPFACDPDSRHVKNPGLEVDEKLVIETVATNCARRGRIPFPPRRAREGTIPRVRARALWELAALAAGLALAAPGAIRADTAPLTETTVAATTDTTATTPAPTTTTPAAPAPPPTTTPAVPTPAPATTAPAAPTATTPPAETTMEATTTAPAPPVAAALAAAPAPQSGCPPVGAVAVLKPHQRPLVLAPVRQLTSAQVAYPADGSVLRAAGVSL